MDSNACEICGQIASVRTTVIRDGKTVERHLCAEHAELCGPQIVITYPVMRPPPEDAKVDVGVEVKALLHAWCDRRCYDAICQLYGASRAVNGLSDGWAEFVEGLKRLRNLCKEPSSGVTEAEAEKVQLLIGVVSRSLNWR
jgi:hypothetical protein